VTKQIVSTLTALMLCGCGVRGSEIDRAQTLCKANGGVKYIEGTFLQEGDIECFNGAIFGKLAEPRVWGVHK